MAVRLASAVVVVFHGVIALCLAGQCPNKGTNLDLQCDALCSKACSWCSHKCIVRLVRPDCEGQNLARTLYELCPSLISPIQACYTACTCCRTDVIQCADRCAEEFALPVFKKRKIKLLT